MISVIINPTEITVACKWRLSFERSFIAFIFLLFILGLGFSAQAQLVPTPLPGRAVIFPVTKSKQHSARTKAEPLKLPFWDDFSFTPLNDTTDTLSNYPLMSLWEDSWAVHINEGIGINPPSINVATFDGLDSLGRPYSDQILANGFRDNLTSLPIDLTLVDAAERESVFLSFFYQWAGNGESPDTKDELRIEFKNAQGAWETVITIAPKSSFVATVFYDTIVQVSGDQFFHNAFQFRFRNYGRLSGPYDTWNVDYIYLNKSRNANDLFYSDGSFASTVGPIFGQYNSVPLKHFRKASQITPAGVDVFNLRDRLVSYNYRAFGTFTNYVGDDSLSHTETLVASRGIGTNPDGSAVGAINSFERKRVILYRSPDPANTNQFNPNADSTSISLKFKLVSGDVVDTLGNPAQDYFPFYYPIDFRANDSVSMTYHLKDFYAYDDGTAEYAATLTQAGDRAAYLFEMITDTATINGIEFYFPQYGVTGSLTVDFYIYEDDNGKPGDVLYTMPSRTIQSKGLNQFQFLGTEPVFVSGKFYIGWKAPTGGLLRVGLDLNNNSGEKIFFNSRGSWEQNTDVNGSLMIRPRFGKGGIVTGIPEGAYALSVYPNPSDGTFILRGKMDHLEIITITGGVVPFHHEQQGDEHRISLRNCAAGLYILKIRNGSGFTSRKLVVK